MSQQFFVVVVVAGFNGVKGGEHLMVTQQIVSSQNFQDVSIFVSMCVCVCVCVCVCACVCVCMCLCVFSGRGC